MSLHKLKAKKAYFDGENDQIVMNDKTFCYLKDHYEQWTFEYNELRSEAVFMVMKNPTENLAKNSAKNAEKNAAKNGTKNNDANNSWALIGLFGVPGTSNKSSKQQNQQNASHR